MTDPPSAATEPFESKLATGRERFLSHAIEHALSVRRRTPEDFIRHFPPELIMQGLADQPELRSKILVATTGMKAKIASKKSWQSAAEDLCIALAEKETSPATVVTALHPDDRIRYLDPTRLWAFVVEGDFWNTPSNAGPAHGIAKEHLAFLLNRALVDGLVVHADIVNGVTVAEIATRLPKADLGTIIEGALAAGRRRAPFTEVELWTALTAPVLVEYVPLPHIWMTVVQPKIAEAHGYVTKASPSRPPGSKKLDSEWVDIPSQKPAPGGELVSEDDFA